MLSPEADRSLDPAGTLQSLREAGIGSVVLTLSAAGALVLPADSSESVAVPASPVQAVDTTGAGDAFIGGLAAHLLHSDDLVDAARFAARVGAFAVRAQGAQPSYPYQDDELPAPGEVSR